ncbi:unnamed protein product [Fructobacillus tropaeoli]|nr:unnamed protein product [Fructobacillus tropaeoli]
MGLILNQNGTPDRYIQIYYFISLHCLQTLCKGFQIKKHLGAIPECLNEANFYLFALATAAMATDET